MKDLFYEYLVNVFTDFVKDGIDHLEARFLVGSLYDADGNQISWDDEAKLIKKAIAKVQETYPNFTFAIIAQGLKRMDINFNI